MCGIVGIFDTRSRREIDRVILERMNESQFHRGPDEGGIHVEPGVGLGHRRLSIIDLSSGKQPLYNEDESVVVVYNGEIYNFKELTKELLAKGHVFRTHCDTEVIVHAWEEWGPSCVERFRGMFAFCIWDRNKQTLFLARDRLGIKPLYYALLSDGQFVFSSELKALMVHPELNGSINPYAVEDYFAFGYIPEPKTILSNAFKLPPGYTLTVKQGQNQLIPRCYWDVSFEAEQEINEKQAIEELVERFREAVEIRMVADVPLGAFLSGGVDSSAVVGVMADLLKGEPVNTCSISFGNPEFNESEFAKQVSDRFHTNHHVEQVEPDDFDLIDKLADIYDEPYADSSAMPTYRVCELARKHVTVALSGDGGDENLAGYRRYRWHMNEEKIRGLLPQWLRSSVFGLAGSIYPKIDWAPQVFRAKTTLQAIARDSLSAYMHSVSIMHTDLKKQLYSSDFRQSLSGYSAIEVFREHASRAKTRDPLSMIQYLDLKTYLPGDILTKVDRASMAHSLEVRVPLLDHKLVEWMATLPSNLKLKGQEGKYIFKKSLESSLPNDILYRQKMGFAVPLAHWFRGPLKERVREALLGSVIRETGIFDQRALENIVNRHQAGVSDFSATIWSLLMFEAYQRKAMRTG
ncbi:MAG: amidotransferase 1, exosortase A system-associated [Gammaproteobacteria bacterium]|nr:amidotransferase 1, exosortase A system-associated [Gammaproteobacteria bacterium]MDH5593184.1 amidotransferase 1, exosortase A system-associated [Gammaproteobacteria bacterium]